jgi:hypothetical protein
MVVLLIYGLIDIISAILVGMAAASSPSLQAAYLISVILFIKGILSIMWDAK